MQKYWLTTDVDDAVTGWAKAQGADVSVPADAHEITETDFNTLKAMCCATECASYTPAGGLVIAARTLDCDAARRRDYDDAITMLIEIYDLLKANPTSEAATILKPWTDKIDAIHAAHPEP